MSPETGLPIGPLSIAAGDFVEIPDLSLSPDRNLTQGAGSLAGE